jgi:hypothetical protein
MGSLDDKLAAAKACNRDAPSGPPTSKQNCFDVVNISIFFDGTGNNKEVDEPLKRWSNPARLWRAAQALLDKGQTNYAIYVTGVGTPSNEKATDWMDVKRQNYGDGTGGLVFGAGGTRRTEYGERNVNDALRQALLQNAKNLNISLKPYMEKGKNLSLGELAKALQGHRLISMINLSIFGFSRGAALARAFSNDIVKSFVVGKDGVATYQGFPVRLHFMGLFDTVASFGVPSRNVDLPFDEKNLVVPQQVERCVHYVAANELRFSFPVDLIRKNGVLRANWTEVAYPGVHSDVGGGYEPVNQGISNNYARIPMRDMLRESVRSGVRMVAYDDLEKVSVVLFQERFEVKPQTEQAYKRYVAAVGVPATVEQAMITHMQAWYSAMGTMTRRKMKTPDLVEADSRQGIGKHVGHPGIAVEAELLLGDSGDDSAYTRRTGLKVPKAVLEIGGMRYRMMVRPEPWRLEAWQRTAPDPILDFMKGYVHDSKAGFIMSLEPFSYFRPRGMAESSRNILARGLDWLDDTATAIKHGVIKVYHRAEGVVVETWEEGKLIATRVYRVGEKFVVDTARAGARYSVEVYQSGKKVLISTMKKGEQMIITSIDMAKKEANALADAVQKKASEAGRQIQSGASQAARSAGEAVDAGIKGVEDAWHAAQAAFGF